MCMPVARGQYVYHANPRRVAAALLQLKPSQDGVAAEQVYLERGLPNDIGGQVLVGDYLYGTNAESGLMAVEFLTGKIRWRGERHRLRFDFLRRRSIVSSRGEWRGCAG